MLTINDFINCRKGTIRKVAIKSDSNFLKKGKESDLQKISICYVRFGISYSNMKSTKEYLAQNNLTQVNPLPWGVWVIPNYAIEHKGKTYIRMSLAKLPNLKTKTTYYLNGVEVDKQYLIDNKYIII